MELNKYNYTKFVQIYLFNSILHLRLYYKWRDTNGIEQIELSKWRDTKGIEQIELYKWGNTNGIAASANIWQIVPTHSRMLFLSQLLELYNPLNINNNLVGGL